MKGSLDYRANNITWHVRETMVLLPDALDEIVLQPAKASVIQLNNQQPLQYSIAGGILLAYIMPNISEFSSREELTTYLLHVQNLTVKQCIFILNKLSELNLCQTKQDNSRNDITPGGVRTEGRASFPGSHSNLNSDFQEIRSQCGNEKTASKYLSMPIPTGDDGLRIFPRFCQKQVHDRHSQQYISTHSESPCLSYSQTSNTITDLIGAQAYDYNKYIQPSLIYPRKQTNYHLNANANDVSKLVSNENVYGLKQASDNDPVIRKESDGQYELCELEKYLRVALTLCIFNILMFVSMKLILPIFKGIFNSQEHAVIATVIFDLLCLVLMIHSSME